MVELVYPIGTAVNLTPRSFRVRKEDAEHMLEEGAECREILPVVEPSGEVRGYATRSYCHSEARLLHPVVHLNIINRYGQIYLQKRSRTKKLLPGYWDTAVGGHIGYGESVLEALFREASEELAFVDFNPVYLENSIWESDSERELVCYFAAVGNFDLHPLSEEVEEGRYWSIRQIEDNLGKSVFTPNFECEFRRMHQSLEALL